ncbi:hypothetical protein ABPG77_005785 [Micractinium sp. CCAP 211/92]
MLANAAAATAAANSLITRSMRLLQEQCSELAESPLAAALEEGILPCTAVPAASALAGAAPAPALPVQLEAAPASLPSAISVVAAPPTCDEPASECSTAAPASAAMPPLHVRVVSVPPVSPVGGSTPRSALTTAFNLLRTSSGELRAEAAAMAEAVAAAFAAQQQATLSALGLAAPEVVSHPATPLPTPVS